MSTVLGTVQLILDIVQDCGAQGVEDWVHVMLQVCDGAPMREPLKGC